ncbi:hypothetical protein [Candidatus Finniella inopinata]|uniref:Uncharacterized protein n=1 Tax=Candidatus Finniella inopinata TaxID=1696036 RepID=A0A4Q7DJA1_9PROT|nr:hypothetical protein [Candidatus Finniella inopinata]RZI46933.1 hypothetical protein EQU50_01530 [Candidatus Finniella inopinata]
MNFKTEEITYKILVITHLKWFNMFKITKKSFLALLCVLSIQYCMASSADVDASPSEKKPRYFYNLSQKVQTIQTKLTSFHKYVTHQMIRLKEFKKSTTFESAPFVTELMDCRLQTSKEQGHSGEFMLEKEAAFFQIPRHRLEKLAEIQFSIYSSIEGIFIYREVLKALDTLIVKESFAPAFPLLCTKPQRDINVAQIIEVIKKIKYHAQNELKKFKPDVMDKPVETLPFITFREEANPILTPNAIVEILENEIKGILEAILNLKTFEEEEKAQKNRNKKRKQKQARKLKESQSQTVSSAAAPAGQVPASSSSSNSSSSSSSSSEPAPLSSEEDEEEDAQGEAAGAASSSSSSAAQTSKKAFTRMEEEKAQQQKQIKRQEDLKDLISKTFSPLYNTIDWSDWEKALRQNGYSVEQGGNGKKSYINGITRKKFAIENAHGEGSNKFSPANIGIVRTFCLDQGLVPNGILPDHMIQPWLKTLQTAEAKH